MKIKFKDGTTADIKSKPAPVKTQEKCVQCGCDLFDYEALYNIVCSKCIIKAKQANQ